MGLRLWGLWNGNEAGDYGMETGACGHRNEPCVTSSTRHWSLKPQV